MTRFALLVVVLGLAACDTRASNHIVPMMDATVAADSGQSTPDTGVVISVDSGPPDSGPPDSGLACSESPCRLVSPQCGCPSGMGCDIEDHTIGRVCAPIGTTPEGGACLLIHCQAGMNCVTSTTTLAWCERYCTSDADCVGGPGSLCLNQLADSTGTTLSSACTISCDPVTNAGCTAGASCGILNESAGAMRPLTDCVAAGTGGQGALCTDDSSCQPGYGCINGGSGALACQRWCRTDGSTTCPAGTCTPLNPPATVGGISYGACF